MTPRVSTDRCFRNLEILEPEDKTGTKRTAFASS